MITLTHYLVLGALLFGISAMGISQHLGDTAGQIFVFFVLTVAAAESAIGLAIMVLVYRNRQTINVADLDDLKG